MWWHKKEEEVVAPAEYHHYRVDSPTSSIVYDGTSFEVTSSGRLWIYDKARVLVGFNNACWDRILVEKTTE